MIRIKFDCNSHDQHYSVAFNPKSTSRREVWEALMIYAPFIEDGCAEIGFEVTIVNEVEEWRQLYMEGSLLITPIRDIAQAYVYESLGKRDMVYIYDEDLEYIREV